MMNNAAVDMAPISTLLNPAVLGYNRLEPGYQQLRSQAQVTKGFRIAQLRQENGDCSYYQKHQGCTSYNFEIEG